MQTTVIYGDRIGKTGELRLGCSAVLFNADRSQALLTRRSDNGLWCLPGGRIEAGESVAEACAREFLEETGLTIQVLQLTGVYSNPHRLVVYPDGNKVHMISLNFLVEKITGEMVLTDETTQIGFFDLSDLINMEFLSDHRERVFDSLHEGRTAVIK